MSGGGRKQLPALGREGPRLRTPRDDERRPKKVFVQIIFLKISDIATAQEKFTADLFLQCRWREPALDDSGPERELTAQEVARLWSPLAYVENVLGEVKEETWHTLRYYDGKAFVCNKRRLKGTFFETMELVNFPFDSQDLTVNVSTEKGEGELEFYMDPDDASYINQTAMLREQEWIMHTHIKQETRTTTNVYSSTSHKHPAIALSCKTTRRPNYFIYNVILIMIFITGLALCTFTVAPEAVQNRLQITFTLILSLITFKFTVSNSLPKVSYMTTIDRFVVGVMFHIVMIAGWHALVGYWARTRADDDVAGMDRAVLADRIAFACLLGLYLIAMAIFIVKALLRRRRKNREYGRRDREFKDNMAAREQEEPRRKKHRKKVKRAVSPETDHRLSYGGYDRDYTAGYDINNKANHEDQEERERADAKFAKYEPDE